MASKTKAGPEGKRQGRGAGKGDAGIPGHPAAAARPVRCGRQEAHPHAKKRGYVTHDQINSVLPSEEVNSEQIEDVLAMFSEMGVNVVENEEAEPEEEAAAREEPDEEAESEGGELVEVAAQAPGQGRDQGADRAHRRSRAHVSARNGLGGAALARGRNRHRQAHRGRPRGHDRGPVREPADLPGHHHLARRAQRGKGLPPRHHRSRSHLCRSRRQGDAGAR